MDRIRKYFSEIPDSYIIVQDFDDISEKDCIKYDRKNEEIYRSLLNRAEKAKKTLGKGVLCIDIDVPIPPRPSNRDRYSVWQKRNISKPVIEQSRAVLFLKSKNYELDKDYEAYQAIELANEIRKLENIKEPSLEESNKFDNLYTSQDTNLMRRRSMLKAYNDIKPSAPPCSSYPNLD